MSWLSQLLNPGGGYKKANQTMQNYYNQAQGNLSPYNQNGQAAQQQLMEYLKNLSNPAALQEGWGKNYKESDYGKNLEREATQRGQDYASSMGLGGSSAAMNNAQKVGAGIRDKDQQQYMDDLMKKYLAGMGLGENISQTGAGAAGQMSNNAMNQGQNQANMEFGQYNAGPNALAGGASWISNLIQQYLNGGMGQGGYGRGMFTPSNGQGGY